jgi:hypothetical protein
MESPWRPKRLGAMVAVWILTCLLGIGVASAGWSATVTFVPLGWTPWSLKYAAGFIQATSAVQSTNPAPAAQQFNEAKARWTTDLAETCLRWHHGAGRFGPPPSALGIIAANLGVVAVLGGVPHTRQLHRVRTRHLTRAMVFGLGPLAMGILFTSASVVTLCFAQLASTFAPTVSHRLASIGGGMFDLTSGQLPHVFALGWLIVYWCVVVSESWRLGGRTKFEVTAACLIALVLAYTAAAVHSAYWFWQ